MLRHRVDLGELVGVDRSVEQRKVLPMFKAAVKLEFRRDGDTSAVTDAMRSHHSIQLNAAVGAGKSTEVPSRIAKAQGALVIHTVPFHLAAQFLADYLMKISKGNSIVYADDLEADLPTHGVVLMSNAHLAARYINRKMDNVEGAVLYLDEIHESDCWTAVLRKVAPGMKCFSNVIHATATSDPGACLKPHLPGQRLELKYAPERSDSWSAFDKGKPWSASSIQGNTMICMDREVARNKLLREYQEYGFAVRVLTARSTYDQFLEVVAKLKDRGGELVIVFVDYAYRSSFTIPGLEVLIDSCEVGVPTLDEDGVPGYKYRSAYEFEVQQFLGRGGRLPGETVKLYRTSKALPDYMCDLELLEADAANLIYRLFGFRPPMELREFDFYEGDVPLDISAGLLSDHPLKACPSESRVAWVNGQLPLQEAKKKEKGFVYGAPVRGRSAHMTCQTIGDDVVARSPPPPVPARHAITRVTSQVFDDYAESRESSPSGTAYTIDSGEPDTLSMFERREELMGGKPKRVAKRVLEERAAAAALRSALDEQNKQQQVEDMGKLVEVPDFPSFEHSQSVQTAEASKRPLPIAKDTVSFLGVGQGAQQLHATLSKRAKDGENFLIPESELGTYVFYHGMEKAPSSSMYFVSGYDSILGFVESRDAKRHVSALPDRDKLYAMKVLVDQFNQSTAITVGMQRLFNEISRRDHGELESLVDHGEMIETLEWMMNKRTDAELVVRMCRNIMPLFMRYELDVMPPASQLEEQVMLEMMDRFESVAVKKDPEKMGSYLRSLNDRKVRVRPVVGRGRTPLYLK